MTRHLKQAMIAVAVLSGVLVMTAAYSHILLPASVDPCQQDETHLGHIAELPPFHCIGHSEKDPGSGDWDHVHPWMEQATTELIHGTRIVYDFIYRGDALATPLLASF